MTDAGVVAYLYVYSFAMFTVPFAAYFGTQYILRDVLNVVDFSNVVWSVIASVFAVNCMLALYAYKAYYEEADPQVGEPPHLPPRIKRNDLNIKKD